MIINAKSISEAVEWIRERKDTVLSVAGVIVVSIGLGIYFFVNYSTSNRDAWSKLAYAQGAVSRGLHDQALTLLDEILGKRTGKELAQHAKLSKAEVLYNMKKYQEAKTLYQEIITDAGFKPVLPFAYLGLGNTLEEMREYQQAVTIYNEFIDTMPEHYLVPRAYESLARTYESLGSVDMAKLSYEKLSTLYPGTMWSKKAQDSINAFLKSGSNPQ